MAIVVETGVIVTGANSYVSITDATTYATARGVTFTGVVEAMLIQAMDYIENQNYIGTKYTQDQSLQWPRYGAYIDGYLFAADAIPQNLINAQIETALAIDAGNSPLANSTQNVKSQKVDTLEITYQDGSTNNAIVKKINNYLKKLLANGGGVNNFRVSKA